MPIFKRVIVSAIVCLSGAKSFAGYTEKQLVSDSVKSLFCKDSRFDLFENLQKFIMEGNSVPAISVLLSELRPVLTEKLSSQLSSQQIANVTEALTQFYKISLEEMPKGIKRYNPQDSSSVKELKQVLGAIKIGDRSSPVSERLQNQYKKVFDVLQDPALLAGLPSSLCSQYSLNASTSLPVSFSAIQNRAFETQTPLAVLGLRRAFATAYQSCESLRLEPMTKSTPSCQGVVDAGPYPGGGGRLRKITNQGQLAETHYYVKNVSPAPGCVDVKKYTMIYDYGGKPFTTSSSNSSLNYWKTNRAGSKGLGIDCSGYVFTSLAAGGLRLVKGRPLKAFEVEDYPARMYIRPARNGFSCLENAQIGKNFDLKPGDIISSKYHIVMVDSVGKDPLAIRKYQDCNEITYFDFDFVVAQSSPEQNSIGINRYSAKDYFSQKYFNPIQYGLVSFARSACQAYQQNRDIRPTSSSFGVARHVMTDECLQPDLSLDGSACIDGCGELFNR